MPKRKLDRLYVKNLGPIKEADVSFGDLTVLVGPQASGKSIFLQTLKLALDRNNIHDTFEHHNVVFNSDEVAFLGGYFGKGMSSIWGPSSDMRWSGKSLDLHKLSKPGRATDRDEKMFYIPAQRVVSLPGGVSQNFSNFKYGDPYVLRHFSDSVHDLLQNEFGAKSELFPQPNRLNETLRQPISEHLFGGAKLAVDAREFTKTLVIRVPGHRVGLPFLAWSAGQREFTPLLLGLYWLCPGGSVSRRGALQWVVIEEPEMGLHPRAISTLLLLVLELMRRKYRVVLSTHSPAILDMVWAIRQFQSLDKNEADIRELFELPTNPYSKSLSKSAMSKYYKVYFLDRNKAAADISNLDPSSMSQSESEWGGLVGFSSRTANVIAKAVNRHQNNESGRIRKRNNIKKERGV